MSQHMYTGHIPFSQDPDALVYACQTTSIDTLRLNNAESTSDTGPQAFESIYLQLLS